MTVRISTELTMTRTLRVFLGRGLQRAHHPRRPNQGSWLTLMSLRLFLNFQLRGLLSLRQQKQL